MAIWCGSWIFYGWGRPSFLAILVIVTIWTWVGGLILEKRNSKKVYVFFFTGCILLLGCYKYTSFLLANVNRIGYIFGKSAIDIPEILVPVGLSFYIFQVCSYLGDVHHEKMRAEHNFIRYASFASFFPTILSGPIQKARDLLPQLVCPRPFEYTNALHDFWRVMWGIFTKICVADQLSYIIESLKTEENDPWMASWYLFSAIGFSIYIYADFASYSDIAIGLAQILGIYVRPNFLNPYLSCSLTEFWERWHVSLNEWLVEYVYIPLGGNRHGLFRKYINIMIVFLISGLWHGASWHYVLWGGLNGLLMVLGQCTQKARGKVYEKLHIGETASSIMFWKRGVVFALITFTWLFFNHGLGMTGHMLKTMISASLAAYCNPGVWSACGTVSKTIVVFSMIIIFLILQCQRNGRSNLAAAFYVQPDIVQIILIGILMVLCIFMGNWNSTTVNTGFLYFQV